MPDPKDSDWIKFLNRSVRGVQDFSLNTLHNLPEPVQRPIRHAVGRVVSNVNTDLGYIDPMSTLRSLVSPAEIGNTIRTIARDQPFTNLRGRVDAHQQARRPLIREFFDLPPQDPGKLPPGYFGQPPPIYLKQGKDYRINPETDNPEAAYTLDQFKKGSSVGRPHNPIGANYIPGHPDPYNFDLHPDELSAYSGKPLPPALFARSALEAIGKPARLMTGGYYNPPPKENLSYFPAVNDIYRR